MGTGSHIIYVNGSYRDDTPIGKLMHDFSCTQPADMNYGILAERARYFKESKEGIAIMCKAMEDMRNESVLENLKQIAVTLIALGDYTFEKIAEITNLSVEEVKRLAEGKLA